MNHGVPWDACVDGFDIGLPQVYFPEQRRKLDQVIDDHRGKPLHVAVCPGDDPAWTETAKRGLADLPGNRARTR
jgi:hypothetical protein